jgi:hypothetical protein
MQRDEINQSLHYSANRVDQQDIITVDDESYEEECTESTQATMDQLLEVAGYDNVKETWAVKVGNSCP